MENAGEEVSEGKVEVLDEVVSKDVAFNSNAEAAGDSDEWETDYSASSSEDNGTTGASGGPSCEYGHHQKMKARNEMSPSDIRGGGVENNAVAHTKQEGKSGSAGVCSGPLVIEDIIFSTPKKGCSYRQIPGGRRKQRKYGKHMTSSAKSTSKRKRRQESCQRTPVQRITPSVGEANEQEDSSSSEYALCVDENAGTEEHVHIDKSIDKTIEEHAVKNNLTANNVKSILRSLITHELVQTMLRNSLVSMAENQDETVFEPKLTRSKMKQVLQKGNDTKLWPVSPAKLGRPAASGPSILDVDFTEDEDEDDEYRPDKDVEDLDSDEESVTSSQVGDIGSPIPSTPRSPFTSVSSIASTPVSKSMASPMGPPKPPRSRPVSRLTQQFRSSMKALEESQEEQDVIAGRTRSKLPLTTTSLYDIEEAFVAPDITPDMYDTYCDDTDWQDFLKGLHKCSDVQNESMEVGDDEQNDPEFNYLAEAETEELDEEDFRFDKPFRIPRKELNELMEELDELFNEDDSFSIVGLCTNLASSHQHTTNKNSSSDGEENSAQPELIPVTDTQMRQIEEQIRKHIQLTCQMYVLAQGSFDYKDMALECRKMIMELKVFGDISMAGSQSVYNACSLIPAVELVSHDVDWDSELQTRLQKQMPCGAVCKETLSKSFPSNEASKGASNETLQGALPEVVRGATSPQLSGTQESESSGTAVLSQSSPPDSEVRAESSQAVDTPSSSRREERRCPLRSFMVKLLEVQKREIWNSPVFLYPALLPTVGLLGHSVPQPVHFSLSEDRLIAMGLEQFSKFKHPAAYIQRLMVPCKTVSQIRTHIKNMSAPRGVRPNNPIKYYREHGKLRTVPHLVEKFSPNMMKAPKDQPEVLLPMWCKHYRDQLRREENMRWAAEQQERLKQKCTEKKGSVDKHRKRHREQTSEFDSSSSEEDMSEEDSDIAMETMENLRMKLKPRVKRQKIAMKKCRPERGRVSVKGTYSSTPITILPSAAGSPNAIITSSGIFVPLHLASPSRMNSALASSTVQSSSSGNKQVLTTHQLLGIESTIPEQPAVKEEDIALALPGSVRELRERTWPEKVKLEQENTGRGESQGQQGDSCHSDMEVTQRHSRRKNRENRQSQGLVQDRLGHNSCALQTGQNSGEGNDGSQDGVNPARSLHQHNAVDTTVEIPSSPPSSKSCTDQASAASPSESVSVSMAQQAVALKTNAHDAQVTGDSVYVECKSPKSGAGPGLPPVDILQLAMKSIVDSPVKDDASSATASPKKELVTIIVDTSSGAVPPVTIDNLQEDFSSTTIELTHGTMRNSKIDEGNPRMPATRSACSFQRIEDASGCQNSLIRVTYMSGGSSQVTVVSGSSGASTSGLTEHNVGTTGDIPTSHSCAVSPQLESSDNPLTTIVSKAGQVDPAPKFILHPSSSTHSTLAQVEMSDARDCEANFISPVTDRTVQPVVSIPQQAPVTVATAPTTVLHASWSILSSVCATSDVEVMFPVIVSDGEDTVCSSANLEISASVLSSEAACSPSHLQAENERSPTKLSKHFSLTGTESVVITQPVDMPVLPTDMLQQPSMLLASSVSSVVDQLPQLLTSMSTSVSSMQHKAKSVFVMAPSTPAFTHVSCCGPQTVTTTSPQTVSATSPTPSTTTQQEILEKTPTKSSPAMRPIAPKPGAVSPAPQIELEKKSWQRMFSPKKQQLQQQVRAILPKGYVYEMKMTSPTKAAARSLKKKATLICQRSSPNKPILPLPAYVAQANSTRPVTRGFSCSLTTPITSIKVPWTRRGAHLAGKKLKPRSGDKKTAEANVGPEPMQEEAGQDESDETASEVEEGAMLSQEDSAAEEDAEAGDEEDGYVSELMAASTTIGFNPHKKFTPDKDGHRSRAEIRTEKKLALLAPDVVDTDPRKDERDTAYAQAYLNKVKLAMQKDPDAYAKFMELLCQFEKQDTSPVQVYKDVCQLLHNYPDLLDDFASFLSPGQALRCGCHRANQEVEWARVLLRKIEMHFDKSQPQYQRVLRVLARWDSKPGDPAALYHALLPLLRSVPGYLLDEVTKFFPQEYPPDSHLEDFEDVALGDSDGDDNMASPDEFEEIELAEENDPYRTKRCPCPCHTYHSCPKRLRGVAHCIKCSLRVYNGRLYFQPGKDHSRRPACVTFHDPVPMPAPPADRPPSTPSCNCHHRSSAKTGDDTQDEEEEEEEEDEEEEEEMEEEECEEKASVEADSDSEVKEEEEDRPRESLEGEREDKEQESYVLTQLALPRPQPAVVHRPWNQMSRMRKRVMWLKPGRSQFVSAMANPAQSVDTAIMSATQQLSVECSVAPTSPAPTSPLSPTTGWCDSVSRLGIVTTMGRPAALSSPLGSVAGVAQIVPTQGGLPWSTGHPSSAVLSSDGGAVSFPGPDNTVIMFNPALSARGHNLPSRHEQRKGPSDQGASAGVVSEAPAEGGDAMPVQHELVLPTLPSPSKNMRQGSFAGLLPRTQRGGTVGCRGEGSKVPVEEPADVGKCDGNDAHGRSASLSPPVLSQTAVAALLEQCGDEPTQSNMSFMAGLFEHSNTSPDLLAKAMTFAQIKQGEVHGSPEKGQPLQLAAQTTAAASIFQGSLEASADTVGTQLPTPQTEHNSAAWSREEDKLILEKCKEHGPSEEIFTLITLQLVGRTKQQVVDRLATLMQLATDEDLHSEET